MPLTGAQAFRRSAIAGVLVTAGGTLGYMLIDYDLDLARGMALVQKAMVFEPKNPAFAQKIGSKTGVRMREAKIWENPEKKTAHDVDSSDSFSNVDRVGGRRDRKERM